MLPPLACDIGCTIAPEIPTHVDDNGGRHLRWLTIPPPSVPVLAPHRSFPFAEPIWFPMGCLHTPAWVRPIRMRGVVTLQRPPGFRTAALLRTPEHHYAHLTFILLLTNTFIAYIQKDSYFSLHSSAQLTFTLPSSDTHTPHSPRSRRSSYKLHSTNTCFQSSH